MQALDRVYIAGLNGELLLISLENPRSRLPPFGRVGTINTVHRGRRLQVSALVMQPRGDAWAIGQVVPREGGVPLEQRFALFNFHPDEPEQVNSFDRPFTIGSNAEEAGLAWSPPNDLLVGVGPFLHRVNATNPEDETGDDFGRLGQFPARLNPASGMTLAETNVLWVAENDTRSTTSHLWRVNVNNPPSTSGDFGQVPGGPMLTEFVQALAASGDGTLYAMAGTQGGEQAQTLWRINPANLRPSTGTRGLLGRIDAQGDAGSFRATAMSVPWIRR